MASSDLKSGWRIGWCLTEFWLKMVERSLAALDLSSHIATTRQSATISNFILEGRCVYTTVPSCAPRPKCQEKHKSGPLVSHRQFYASSSCSVYVHVVFSKLEICIKFWAARSSVSDLLNLRAPTPGSLKPREWLWLFQSAEKFESKVAWISAIGWTYEGLVQASIKSSALYVDFGARNGPFGSAMFFDFGSGTEQSMAVRLRSSRRVVAMGNPAEDCESTSIPNCNTSGPSMEALSTFPG